MGELGRLTAVFDADYRKLDTGISHVKTKITGVTSDLGKATASTNQLTGALAPANVGLSGFTNKLGAAAGVSVIAATAIGGVVTGLFNLAQSTAEYGGNLQDLNDQTGIGVKTLSALKLAFDQSGGSIDSGATALSRYLRSVSDANTGNDKLKQKFLDVGFTVDDLNAAYGDSDKAIEILVKRVGEHSNSQDRLNALQKLGVRNGQELNGAIIAMRGNLEEFRAEAERLGLVITPEQAKAADDFDDSLNLLTKQIKGMSYSIAHQYIPQISGAIHDLSGALSANKGAWSSWGSFINTEIRGIRVAVAGLATFMSSFSVTGMMGLSVAEGVAGAIKKSRSLHLADSFSADASVGSGIFRSKGLGISGGGGGGGKGGGGGGSAKKDPGVELLKQLEEQLRDLTPRTESQKIQEKLLGDEFKKTTDAIKKKVQITAMDIDLQKMVLAITRERVISMKTERQEFEEMIDLVRQAGDQGLPFFSRRRTTMDLTGLLGTGATRPRSIADGATRERIATVDEQVMRERLQMIRDQMHDLAADLTSVFDRAIYDGIHGGGKRGLQSLALGFLDMIQQVILGQLKNAIAQALETGASSGGLLGKILRLFIGSVAGGVSVGGGASTLSSGMTGGFAGGFAGGGKIGAGQWGIVGEHGPELVRAGGMGAQVVPNSKMGGTTVNHFNFTVRQKGLQTFKQNRTKRELAERVAALVSP